ncbi:MAG: DUF559 domain-containing protein [Bacteroidetes bacterium]|nr:DUF559 domain-containing protein [Bacteroidota bacterium]MBL7103885.1 DUF559 domain-containing protein [Bacteroidales bacterium]
MAVESFNVLAGATDEEKELEKVGFMVIRFPDEEVLSDIENVRRVIEYWVDERQRELKVPPPNPRQRGKIAGD